MAIWLKRIRLYMRPIQNCAFNTCKPVRHSEGNDVVTLCREGRLIEALDIFHHMDQRAILVDSDTHASLLQACANMKALPEGKQLHSNMLITGSNRNVYLENNIMTMYSKCGNLVYARQVFDKMTTRNVFSWNVIIATYVRHGEYEEALTLYYRMHRMGMQTDHFTFPCVLKACAGVGALQQGKAIHEILLRSGLEFHAIVGSALVAMYAKCGSITDAHHVFDKMSERDVVSWNAMITGYAQIGQSGDALKLFCQMQQVGVKTDLVTIPSVLSACSHLAALQQGKEIHDYIIKNGYNSDLFVMNSLIDMYAKCGSLEDASHLFGKMSQTNVVSWTVMIAGFGMHGQSKESLRLFYQMQQLGMKPNHITFTAVLSACSHSGLVDEGWQYFKRMNQDYQIMPAMEHYACMVDLLGRSGQLDEALEFIQNMPLVPQACMWGSLLGACRTYRNIELGEYVAERLFKLEPENAGNYVSLSNIYAMAGKWEDVAKVRKMMKERSLMKKPGCSWIEIRNMMHTFFQGDRSHPQTKEIYATLETLSEQMKGMGYVPDTNFVLFDVDDEEKEHMLSCHSEKLAIAFGLINTCPGTPIRITKNLRVCDDCHTATKLISKIVDREIIVRDANRFHCFKHGHCSCGDYWG
eukprot:Gb_08049 [translate_table: standard]